MGNIVEVVVVDDYMKDRISRGGVVDVFPSLTARDFFDLHDDRCEALASFMKLRNSFVDEILIRDFCRQRKVRDGDKSMVPDVITHDGPLQEFYEIKPGSASGRVAGGQKIRNFDELRSGMQTAYQPGAAYNPNVRKVFWTGVWAGVPARVSLRFRRDSEALVLYEFCVEVTAETVTQAALFIILRAAIVATLLTKHPVLIPAVARLSMLLARSPLLQSVGNNGVNDVTDTRYVQRLLNDWRGRRELPLLLVDGIAGSNTAAAIKLFQQAETGGSDGRIDAGGAANAALERLHVDSLPPGVSGELLDADNRAQLDEISLAAVLSAPSHADEPGVDPISLDPLEVLSTSLDEYLFALHDLPFDLV
ncbi:peptidoglycan-binding domain-containing protein [Pseudarthrobacter oxydans]|uniref:peptidoglycan-binding domain-containing protein n=1 Tax=Pseudarthrobacter oxydans TaxID=1671 RepID=UPI0035ED778C